MTQEQQDKTVVIAKYDNKLFFGKPYADFLDGKHKPPDVSKYSTSDDWIMPVARKVWRELNDLLIADIFNNELLDMVQEFEFSAFQSTAELCTEVYQAIIYLQSLKPAQ